MRETVGQRGTVALAGSSSRSYIQPMQRRGFTQLRPTERRPSAARVREHALRIGREHLQRPRLRDRAALGLRAGELPHQHAHRYLTRGQKGASTSRRRRHNRPVSGLGGNVQNEASNVCPPRTNRTHANTPSCWWCVWLGGAYPQHLEAQQATEVLLLLLLSMRLLLSAGLAASSVNGQQHAILCLAASNRVINYASAVIETAFYKRP